MKTRLTRHESEQENDRQHAHDRTAIEDNQRIKDRDNARQQKKADKMEKEATAAAHVTLPKTNSNDIACRSYDMKHTH